MSNDKDITLGGKVRKPMKIKGDKYCTGDEVILTVGTFKQKFKIEKVTDKGSIRLVCGKDDYRYVVYVSKNRDLLIYPQKPDCKIGWMTGEIQRSSKSSYRRGALVAIRAKNFELTKVEEKEMDLNDLKRGMRVTLVNGTKFVVKEYSEDGEVVVPVTNLGFLQKDCSKKERKLWDIALVEDLDDYGEYYELYKRKAPNRYYFTPKGMTLDCDEVLCLEENGKWCMTTKGDYGTENAFTLEEFAELGLDEKHFDKQLVQVGE